MMLPMEKCEGARPWPPRQSEFTHAFWQALAERRFISTRCGSCGKPSFPPKAFCPHCWSDRIEWVPLSPGGVIYSSTVVHATPAVFQAHTPYRVGIVDLDDGVRIATRILGVEQGFGVGARAGIVVLEYDDGPLFAARMTQ
jgi:uncharacterized OB-fold protein